MIYNVNLFHSGNKKLISARSYSTMVPHFTRRQFFKLVFFMPFIQGYFCEFYCSSSMSMQSGPYIIII